MAIHLRQICLVAEKLEPVIDDLTAILGIESCYIDPAVAKFGLENNLMALGTDFLEVVAPVQENTAAGRYLQRRQGDGGYMVITQADSKATQQHVRANAADNNVRIAWESERDDWHLIQFHPGDLEAAFLEVETDAHNDFTGPWHPVGGTGWENKVNQTTTHSWQGVELQSDNPIALANKWAAVLGLPVNAGGEDVSIQLENSFLKFVPLQDDRGPGLSAIHLKTTDQNAIETAAKARGCYIARGHIRVCGVDWYLH